VSPTLGSARRVVLTVAALVAASGVASCAPEGPRPLRAWTDNFEFRVTSDPSPPRAREPIRYRVVVLDRKTGQFVEGGDGQIYAVSADRVRVYDTFEPAPEAGTYTARLSYITAGDWNVALRFRRDTTVAKYEEIEDWVQTVRGARPISERPFTDAPDTAATKR